MDAGRDIAEVLTRLKPDVCFNALHGAWGEDGCVQGVLETLGLPYTHSGVLASALATDKAKAKAVLAAAGVAVPGGGHFNRFDVARDHVLAPPYVVKPNAEGSSVGVFLVFEGANAPPQDVVAPSWTFGEEVMIEPYIRGRELAVGVMDGKAMTVTDIIPRTGFYDYEAKYAEGGSTHIVPAEIPPHAFEKALRMSEAAHAALLRRRDDVARPLGHYTLELRRRPLDDRDEMDDRLRADACRPQGGLIGDVADHELDAPGLQPGRMPAVAHESPHGEVAGA